jgi:general nucleoside transport system permease protein
MTEPLSDPSATALAEPSPSDDNSPPQESFAASVANAFRYGNTAVIVLLAFLCSLVVGAILIVAADKPTRTAMGYFFQSPGDTFSRGWHAVAAAYVALFQGSVFNSNSLYSNSGVGIFYPICQTLNYATPLILGGLAVAVAFRAGLFNIGVQGQIIAGAICAGYVGFHWQLPHVIHLILALAAGIVGGTIWGAIVGWLKAATGAHEVITTIMLNYIAVNLVAYLLTVKGYQRPNSIQPQSAPIHGTARLPYLFGQKQQVTLGLLIAFAAALGCWWLLTRSTIGFRLRAVGANSFAARTAGMSVRRSYVLVMALSGLLAGLAGCSQILGANAGSGVTAQIDGGFGFIAITVALLGFASPGGVVAAGLLFGAFQAGSVQLLANTSTPQDVANIMQYVIVLFIAAPGLVRLIFRLREARGGGGHQLAKGWNG